jgi:hypothetical protein
VRQPRSVVSGTLSDRSWWKDHDSYQKAFDRLLKDLKATDTETKDIATTHGQL